jgi:hypothetical protein
MVLSSECFPERIGMLQVHAGTGEEKELPLVVPILTRVHEVFELRKLVLDLTALDSPALDHLP